MLLNGTKMTCFGKLTKVAAPVLKAPSWLPGQVARVVFGALSLV